jgi:hypothetical protein
MFIWLLGLAMLGAVMAAPMPKSRITVKADKHTDFRTLRTYAWTNGWVAFDRVLDRHIVAAIDAELASLGLTKRMAEPCDVIVTYGALRRTDVDVHADRPHHSGTYPEYPVATLVVLMMQPGSRRELFRARVDVPVETDTSHLEQQIDTIVAQMFADYPTRH